MPYYIMWAAAFVILCIIEVVTPTLVTIWFAAGALITLIAVALGLPEAWQIPVFLVSSLLILALTRPVMKKKTLIRGERTNADRVIGKTGVVRESITPDKFSGSVTVAGQLWSAVSEDGGVIGEGEEVIVSAIEGVKLIVAPKSKAALECE